MPVNIPKAVKENDYDDLGGVEDNLDTLYEVYMRPVDALRSKAKPTLSVPQESENVIQKQEDPIDALETRTHAFYRMLGMPVVSKTAGYYNPGFNPTSDKTKDFRKQINSAIYQEKTAQEFIYERENKTLELQRIFKIPETSLQQIVFNLVSDVVFPFALFDPSIDHLEKDKQNISLEDREVEYTEFGTYNLSDVDSIVGYGIQYSNVFHAIKPFVVDPRIEEVVMPDINKVCVPFLSGNKDDSNTKLEKNKPLYRPGIEAIIHLRLMDSTVSEEFLINIQNILNNTPGQNTATSIQNTDYQLIIATVQSLTESSTLPNNVKEELNNITNLQFNTVVRLVKTIKFCVKELIISQLSLRYIKEAINWVPIFDGSGPISGKLTGKISSSYKNKETDQIQDNIRELKVKKEEALINFNVLNGSFASPFIKNTFSEKINSYNESIDNLISYQDESAAKGFEALRKIEIVKGEVAGIGLVDILAVYLGLWSISTDDLLLLLDDDSVNRLWENNPKYRGTQALINRKATQGTSQTVLSALKKLEEKVFYTLSFADRYYQELKNPQEYSNSMIE